MADAASPSPLPDTSLKPAAEGKEEHKTSDPALSLLDPKAVAIPPHGPEGSIAWTASEYIAHEKSVGWFLALGLVAIIAAALVWLLTKDKISTGVIITVALILGVYATRKPRQLHYQLDESGLSIDEKYYDYMRFRSFSITPEGTFSSISFSPLKRFAPLLTIYYSPEDESKIVALLSARLPIEPARQDIIDQALRRIRF